MREVKDLKEQIRELSIRQIERTRMNRFSKRCGPHKDHVTWNREFNKKRADLKDEIRYLHLAVAFLKGVPYKKLERKCNEKPKVLNIVRSINPVTGCGPIEWTVMSMPICEGVKKWLEG